MLKYELRLNSNGDGFKCFVEGSLEQYLKAVHLKPNDLFHIPHDYESSARLLKKKEEYCYRFIVLKYVSMGKYTIGGDEYDVKITDESTIPNSIKSALSCTTRQGAEEVLKGEIPNADTASIDLWHEKFEERQLMRFSKPHNFFMHFGHKESKESLITFIQERERHYQNNFKIGYEYQKLPFHDLSWLCIFVGYYYERFKDMLAATCLGSLFTCKSHYCEDFNSGYNVAKLERSQSMLLETQRAACVSDPLLCRPK